MSKTFEEYRRNPHEVEGLCGSRTGFWSERNIQLRILERQKDHPNSDAFVTLPWGGDKIQFLNNGQTTVNGEVVEASSVFHTAHLEQIDREEKQVPFFKASNDRMRDRYKDTPENNFQNNESIQASSSDVITQTTVHDTEKPRRLRVPDSQDNNDAGESSNGIDWYLDFESFNDSAGTSAFRNLIKEELLEELPLLTSIDNILETSNIGTLAPPKCEHLIRMLYISTLQKLTRLYYLSERNVNIENMWHISQSHISESFANLAVQSEAGPNCDQKTIRMIYDNHSNVIQQTELLIEKAKRTGADNVFDEVNYLSTIILMSFKMYCRSLRMHSVMTDLECSVILDHHALFDDHLFTLFTYL